MSRAIIGGVTGAAGAGLYFNGVGDSMRFVLNRGDWFRLQGSNGGNGASDLKYDELKKLVQQMSTEMGRRQQGITIVSSDHSSGRSAGFYLGVVAIGGVLYLRVFRGWKLGDMMYVTRASLDSSVGKLSEGLTSLSEKLASARTYLQAQIRTLTTKQDQAMTVQSAMQDHLNVVGRDVEEARCDIAEMHGTVRELDGSMNHLSISQQYANRGIYVLCKVVGDMIKGPSNGVGMRKSAEELQHFVLNPPSLSQRPIAGLEGLLEEPDAAAAAHLDLGSGSSDSGAPPHILGRAPSDGSHMARAATASALPLQQPGHPGSPALDRSQSSASSRNYRMSHDNPKQRQQSSFDMPSTPRAQEEGSRRGRSSSTTTSSSVHSGDQRRQLSAAATWAPFGNLRR